MTDSRPALQLENTPKCALEEAASLLISTQTPIHEDPWPVTTLFKAGMGLFGEPWHGHLCSHESNEVDLEVSCAETQTQVWKDSLHIILKPYMSRKSLDVMDANCKSQVEWLWNPIKQREADKCFILLF